MRIGTGYNILLATQYMARNRADYTKALEPLASGRRINHLGDDPSRLSEYFKGVSQIGRIDQYNSNISAAETRINITDSTLNEINNLTTEAYELTIQGNDETLTPEERTNITDRLAQIKDDIMDLANTKIGNDYIFSGYKSSTKPFAGTPVVFSGDSNIVSVKVTDSKTVDTSIDADATFMGAGGGVDIFATIDSLITSIQAGDTTTTGNMITDLQTMGTQLSQGRSQLGNASKGLETATSTLENLYIQMSERISSLSDVDLATATTDLSFKQYTLESAITVAGKVMQIQLQSFFG